MKSRNSLTAANSVELRKRGVNLPHEGVHARLGTSKVHGVGVFAILDIPRGAYIFPEDDDEIVWIRRSQLAGLDPEVRKLYDDFCIIKNDLYGCPPSFNKLTPAWYFNDSRTPNVAADSEYRFFAIREIKRGEELTVDYDRYSDRPKVSRSHNGSAK